MVFFLFRYSFPYGLGHPGVDGVAGFECGDLGLEDTSRKIKVSKEVKQLVPSAFVREMETEVVEIALVIDCQGRNIEQARKPFDLAGFDRMLDDDDGIVHVATLYQVVHEEIFNLMEEDEGTAGSDLL